jgi:hypothetical protein
MGMKKLILVALCLLAVSASAIQLDSVRQVRVQVYNIHGVDTTGVKDLPTNTVDEYVNLGIRQLNEDVAAYRCNELITSTDGTRFYAIDSMIQVISCYFVSNDTMIGLDYINLEQIDQRVFDAANEGAANSPDKFSIWGDSLWLIPTPNTTGDTFLVLYNGLIPQDSIRLIPQKYRMGVVYYAAYLACKDLGKTLADQQLLWTDYLNFVTSKKKEARELDE